MGRDKREELLYYASGGIFFEVLSLVKAGVDLDKKNSTGQTPSMLAAKESYRRTLELLINSGADIHCCDDKGRTVLHYAIKGMHIRNFRNERNECVEIVQYLVNKGVALNVKTTKGKTPLMMAAQWSQREVVELLINSGADIHCCDNNGWTVLHYASRNECVEVVQYLVNKGVALNIKTTNGKTPLMEAAWWSQREVVELLINSGADIHCCDDEGWTILHLAVTKGWVEIVQCLLNKGVALNIKTTNGKTPLTMAAQQSYREVVELLINSGADIHCCDENGWTILHQASFNGSVEIVQSLLFKGVSINIKASDGSTPLHLAAQQCRKEIVDYLLKAGFDCNIENNEGDSPLTLLIGKTLLYGHWADYYSHFLLGIVESIKLCIEEGAYVKSADYNKMLEDPLLKKDILQDVEICSQAVINKFNNKDLLLLYKGLASSQRLPHVDKMKIGNESGVALEVEQAVSHEIQVNGYCNVSEMVPFGLSILCVKSALESL